MTNKLAKPKKLCNLTKAPKGRNPLRMGVFSAHACIYSRSITSDKIPFTQLRCSSAYIYGLTCGSRPNLDRTTTEEISAARPHESYSHHIQRI